MLRPISTQMICVTLFSLVIAATPALFAENTQSNDHVIFTPEKIKWETGPMSLPKGAQLAVLEGDPSKSGPFTLRLKMPANYHIPPHWHPNIEHITILSGALYVGMGDKFDEKKATKLSAGSFAYMQPEMHHYAFTKTPSIIQLHAEGPWGVTYVNSEDDPRNTEKK